jgi:thiamine monophosphate kinase
MDKKTLVLYFPKGRSTANIILPELDKLEVKYKLHLEGDYELVYIFPEDQIHKVHSVVKFKTQGKNIKPESIKTARKQIKKTANK